MIGPDWASNLADHRCQAARTATLPTAPLTQAMAHLKLQKLQNGDITQQHIDI